MHSAFLAHFANGADQKMKEAGVLYNYRSSAACSDGYAYTSPVGHYPANSRPGQTVPGSQNTGTDTGSMAYPEPRGTGSVRPDTTR